VNSEDEEFERRLKSDLHRITSDERLARLQSAIAELPAKEQEAFVLRNIEELDVRDTAIAMGCSEDSVRTHYSRALHALREKLGEV
jgi:RNA polymerase sigma-70 factor (ECF subfamily)